MKLAPHTGLAHTSHLLLQLSLSVTEMSVLAPSVAVKSFSPEMSVLAPSVAVRVFNAARPAEPR